MEEAFIQSPGRAANPSVYCNPLDGKAASLERSEPGSRFCPGGFAAKYEAAGMKIRASKTEMMLLCSAPSEASEDQWEYSGWGGFGNTPGGDPEGQRNSSYIKLWHHHASTFDLSSAREETKVPFSGRSKQVSVCVHMKAALRTHSLHSETNVGCRQVVPGFCVLRRTGKKSTQM